MTNLRLVHSLFTIPLLVFAFSATFTETVNAQGKPKVLTFEIEIVTPGIMRLTGSVNVNGAPFCSVVFFDGAVPVSPIAVDANGEFEQTWAHVNGGIMGGVKAESPFGLSKKKQTMIPE